VRLIEEDDPKIQIHLILLQIF